MADAYIFNENLNADDRTAIETAVRAAGFDPIYGVPASIPLLDPETNLGVVGLPVEAEDEATVNAAMKAFAGAGIRVVCIWLRKKGSGVSGIPEGIGKYGSATVDINSPELKGTLEGDVDTWEDPGGAPRLTPMTKRNKC